MDKKIIWKYKLPILLNAIAMLVFEIAFFIIGLISFIFFMNHSWNLPVGLAIFLYGYSILNLPITIIIFIYSLICFNENRLITTFEKIINILKWFVFINFFSLIVSFKLKKAIIFFKENKSENYLIISFTEIKKIMWRRLKEEMQFNDFKNNK